MHCLALKLHFSLACLLLALGLIFVAGPGQSVQAQDQQQNMTGPEILARLADDDFAQREQATQALLKIAHPDLDQLGQLYQQAELPEQRHRLRAVIEHHVMARIIKERFDKPSPGAIGIRHAAVAADNDEQVIAVIVTYPGLPGYVHLRVGDLIRAMDGRRLTAQQDQRLTEAFVERIQTKRMGESISLTVIRDGKTVTETFTLGSAQALNDIYNNTAMGFNTSAIVFAQRRRALQKILGGGEHQPLQLKVTLPKTDEGETQDDQGADARNDERAVNVVDIRFGRMNQRQHGQHGQRGQLGQRDLVRRRLQQFRPEGIRLEADALKIQAPRPADAEIQQLLDEIEQIKIDP